MKKSILAVLLTIIMVASILPVQVSAASWTDVSTYAQLKTAIESATVTHIRLLNNIKLENKVATINSSKPELVIEGNGKTLSASNSACLSYALHYNKKGNLKDITVQNMNIDGENYYGIITITDSTLYSDVTVTFDNITYTGPGLAWGRKSNFVIRDSSINIVPSKLCPAHEIFECLRVRLEGDVDIVKNAPSSCESLFWITGSNGGVTVASGANVNVSNNQSGNKVSTSGFVYFSCSNLHIRFEDDSSFNYVGNNVFQKGDAVDDVYVGKRSDVNITTYGNFYCGESIFQVRGKMRVEEDANLEILALNNKDAQPVVELVCSANITFNNPKYVLIYNSSTNICNTGLAIGLCLSGASINFNDVNSIEFWNKNTASYSNLPTATRHWFNPDKSKFSASMTKILCTGKASNVSTTNYKGSQAFTTATTDLKNINVIRINGGTPVKETATIKVICMDVETNTVLGETTHIVDVGTYGPYAPVYFEGFVFIGVSGASDPVTGTINANETKTLIYNYAKAQGDIEGRIIWNDFDNRFSTRSAFVTVGLYRDGTLVQTMQVPANGDGTFKFANVDRFDVKPFSEATMFDAPRQYVYTVAEVTGSGQATMSSGGYVTTVDGYVITKTLMGYDEQEIDIAGQVSWDDNNNAGNTRPRFVEVSIFRNGEAFQKVNVPATGDGNFSFAGLEKYTANGTEYVYTVVQNAVDGYSTAINGTQITNTLERQEEPVNEQEPEQEPKQEVDQDVNQQIHINGWVFWDDNDNAGDTRPTLVEVVLLRDGQPHQKINVPPWANCGFSFTWLDTHAPNGTEYVYTILQTGINGYTTIVDGTDITNVLIADMDDSGEEEPTSDSSSETVTVIETDTGTGTIITPTRR